MKAILFDVDDTLFSTTEFARHAREKAVDAMVEMGIEAPAEEVLTELRGHPRVRIQLRPALRQAPRPPPPHQRRDVNPALIVAAGMTAYHDTKFEHLRAFEDVRPFLESLRAARMRTGIVTHGMTTKQCEKLLRLGIVDLLGPRDIFISEQVGIAKPNPKLYQHALTSMGLLPSEVLYVGDNLAHDIVPPRSIGMHTAWIKRSAKPGQDVEAASPEFIVNDFGELAQILKERFGVPL